MEIQNVTIEDAEELLDIYAPYVKYTAITFEYDVPSVEEFRQRIVNISNRYPYIKAVDNGQIVGYAASPARSGRATSRERPPRAAESSRPPCQIGRASCRERV